MNNSLNDIRDSKGRLHSPDEDTPAISCNGTQAWYKHGKLHRTTGPAMILPGGISFWYIDGWQLSQDEVVLRGFKNIESVGE